MTWQPPDSPAHGPGEFAKARAKAEVATQTLRARAARTVAGQAVSDDDRTHLLSMLGLEDTSAHPAVDETVSLRELERGLAGYVHAVATVLGVPAESIGYEISDTITAYVGLPDRYRSRPTQDLMLVWNEQDGWLVAVEPHPTEPVKVIGYLGGSDILPHPHIVARFVINLLENNRPGLPHPTYPALTPGDLAALLRRHGTPRTGRAV